MRALKSTTTHSAAELRAISYGIFLLLGAITSLNDVIVPKLKALFSLPYAKMMLVPGVFFGTFFCLALPASLLIGRFGHLRTGVVGLALMCAGCLLFAPAASAAAFPLFLGAIFVLAAGITCLQVMINPLTSMLGSASTAPSRLSFSQAFYSLGTTVAPFVGATLILSATAASTGAAVIARVYLVLAFLVASAALLLWWRRSSLVEATAPAPPLLRGLGLLRRPLFRFGVLSAFAYVGVEIAIGSMLVAYLMQPSVMGLSARAAGQHLPLYWGGSMLVRFIGAVVLRHVRPGRVLISATAAALTLLCCSALASGAASGWALLALGLCNAVMYPTIFALTCAGLGERSAEGSGILVMASAGGGLIPVLTGFSADQWGLKAALGVPALCYVVVGCFGLYVLRHARLGR